MFSRKALVAMLVSAFVCAPAWAGEGIADEIRQINEQIALLSAKLKEMEVRAQIATKQAEIDRIGVAGGTPSINQSSEIPVVRGIEGVDGRLTATLAFAGRIQQTVSQGEKIRGGWTVAQIDVSAVTLARGAEKLRLGFGNEPPAVVPSPAGYPGATSPAR